MKWTDVIRKLADRKTDVHLYDMCSDLDIDRKCADLDRKCDITNMKLADMN